MALGYIGTDYQRTPLDILEKIYFNPDSTAQLASRVVSESGLQEWVVLSTCNRVEWYFISETPQKTADWLISQIASIRKIDPQALAQSLKVVFDDAVLTHLFQVVSGIESMVFGENEILSQVKQAHHEAQTKGFTGPFLNKIFQVAIASGKRVRKETLISRGSYSISSIAVECMRQTYPDFLNTKILVLGAGTMGLRAIKKLSALNHANISIANRSEDKMTRLSEKYALHPVPFSKLAQILPQFDIVLVATSSDTYVVESAHLVGYTSEKPLLVIDLSVPRNANPDIRTVPGVTLVSIEGLKQIADETIKSRKNELSKIKTILDDELAQLDKWITYRKGLCLVSE